MGWVDSVPVLPTVSHTRPIVRIESLELRVLERRVGRFESAASESFLVIDEKVTSCCSLMR